MTFFDYAIILVHNRILLCFGLHYFLLLFIDNDFKLT